MNIISYTICIIRQADKVLLLNRNKPYWMGVWNGVGGKLEPGETPRQSVLREIAEETGITAEGLKRVKFKGIVTWPAGEKGAGGMYLYLADLADGYPYETPVSMEEGILDWKTVDWVLHPDNVGVALHLPRYLPLLLKDDRCFNHCCRFEDGGLADFRSIPVSESVEEDGELLLAELQAMREEAK